MDRFEVSFDGATLVGEAGGFGLPVVFLHPDVADRRVWAGQMAAAADFGFSRILLARKRLADLAAVSIDGDRFEFHFPALEIEIFDVLDRRVIGKVDGF